MQAFNSRSHIVNAASLTQDLVNRATDTKVDKLQLTDETNWVLAYNQLTHIDLQEQWDDYRLARLTSTVGRPISPTHESVLTSMAAEVAATARLSGVSKLMINGRHLEGAMFSMADDARNYLDDIRNLHTTASPVLSLEQSFGDSFLQNAETDSSGINGPYYLARRASSLVIDHLLDQMDRTGHMITTSQIY